MRRNKIFIILCVMILSCTTADSREEKILKYSEDKEKADKYEIFLVNPEQYTTKGGEYHQKYHQFLTGIARSVTEEKNIVILERSIGFYYDKREDKKNKLYLGIDIKVPVIKDASAAGYQANALAEIRKYLNDILYVLQSCTTIFKEQDIVGSVIGIRWERDGVNESVSLWIDKNDVMSFESKTLTFDEIIQKSFITNTDGKIIRLLR